MPPMTDYKILLGGTAAALSVVSYLPYIVNILKNKTKPHAFSWLAWSVLTGIGFTAQVVKHGGAGAWPTGTAAFMCMVIFLLSIAKGQRNFTFFDWSALSIALIAIALWVLTDDPLLSVVLVIIADLIAYLPTFRKSYFRPHEETASLYIVECFRFILSIFALESLSLTTWLYPASVIATNASFVAMLFVRRRKLRTSSARSPVSISGFPPFK